MEKDVVIPQVALYNIDKESYIKALSDVEKQISSYKNIARLGINNAIRKIFQIDGDCFQIFEKRSGGILFKDWEWEQITRSNIFKQLFDKKLNGENIYLLNTDEGKILRGADTYYYFLSNKGKNQSVNDNMAIAWAKNNIDFLKQAIVSCQQIDSIDNYDRRFLLGILDNVRNLSLIMLNSVIIGATNSQDSLIDLQKSSNEKISRWTRICEKNSTLMKLLCFSDIIDKKTITDIKEHIGDMVFHYSEDIKSIIEECSESDLNKSLRAYREIDNYIENYIAITFALQNIKERNPEILNRNINFIGASYGGLELPFIANEILNNDILMSTIILQSKYNNRKPNDYIDKKLSIYDKSLYKDTFNILGDDNVLTGKTLQSMINLLFTNDVKIDNIAIVRYPSINRVNQMVAESSAVDLSKFFNYIDGLVFSSPYTKITEQTSGKYLDELGIFNKDRRRLLEYLFKNGRYSQNSEVAQIAQLYKGEE